MTWHRRQVEKWRYAGALPGEEPNFGYRGEVLADKASVDEHQYPMLLSASASSVSSLPSLLRASCRRAAAAAAPPHTRALASLSLGPGRKPVRSIAYSTSAAMAPATAALPRVPLGSSGVMVTEVRPRPQPHTASFRVLEPRRFAGTDIRRRRDVRRRAGPV